MDRDRLERYLEEGLSLSEIGTLEGRHPSTVGYWLKQHGLTTSRAEHGQRVDLDEFELRELASEGLTLAQIAERLGTSQSTIKRRLHRLGIRKRSSSRRQLALEARRRGETRFPSSCRFHGETAFLAFPGGRSRCAKCNSEAVARCRRRRKETLALEAGGKCMLCGYDKHLQALEFHHTDPELKEFGIAQAGVTRSLERCRAEAKKCMLLCANCHAALEAGAITLPIELKDDPDPN